MIFGTLGAKIGPAHLSVLCGDVAMLGWVTLVLRIFYIAAKRSQRSARSA
jgi:hypothetical protein